MLKFFHFIRNLENFFLDTIQNIHSLIYYFYIQINNECYFGYSVTAAIFEVFYLDFKKIKNPANLLIATFI